MSIQFSCQKLSLSLQNFELLQQPDRIGIEVVRRLKSWDLRSSEFDLERCINKLELDYQITMPNGIYQEVCALELAHPGLSRSEVVDGLLWAGLSGFLPAISPKSLIAGKRSANGSLEGAYSDCLPAISEDNSYRGQTFTLTFGTLVNKKKGNYRYWYWQYYDWKGDRKDKCMGKDLNLALTEVRRINIPNDAEPKRLNKGKKQWQLT